MEGHALPWPGIDDGRDGARPSKSRTPFLTYAIPLPAIDIQRQIVADLEAERALVEANRKLVEVFEKKIQARLSEIWGSAADGASDE